MTVAGSEIAGDHGFSRRGRDLLANARPVEAAAALRRAIASGDDSDETQLNLALALDATGRTEQAQAIMRRIARRSPSWDEPHLRLAESHRRQNDYPAAIEAYRCALQRNSNRVESLIGCGALLLMQADITEAHLLLRRSVILAPDHPDAWDALGLACLSADHPDEAVVAFAKARELAPHRFEIALHAADAAAANGSAAGELARVERLAWANPGDPLTHTIRGLLLEHLGRRAEAIDALEAAAALAPAAAIPVGLLGGMLARALRLAEAKVALRTALGLDPDNAGCQRPRCCVDAHAPTGRGLRPAQRSAAPHPAAPRYPLQPRQRNRRQRAAGRSDRPCPRSYRA